MAQSEYGECPGIMSGTKPIVIGRSRQSDLRIDDPTVSSSHARLSWSGLDIVVEDLGSANGTFVDDRRIEKVSVRPGATIRLGEAELPWSAPALRKFLRQGATGTLVAKAIPGKRFVCGQCNTRGVMPPGFQGGLLRCGACGEKLVAGKPKPKRSWLGTTVLLLLISVGAAAFWYVMETRGDELREAAGRLRIPEMPGQSSSTEEASIRAHSRAEVVEAIDAHDPITRNYAARVASDTDGPYSVEQVARIWSHVRGKWRYVNDPRGSEYFASAAETIENEFIGDCDDFAIVLASMVEAIGGQARIVMMGSLEGGHAYPEVCLPNDAEEARARLTRHYRRVRDPNLGRQTVREFNYRHDEACPVWLNLDWNAGVPGGPYETEQWAVAIYPDGRTQTLAPANAPPAE